MTVQNEARVFLEYYLTFMYTSWLKNVCNSLSHCLVTVVSFQICSIDQERGLPLEYAEIHVFFFIRTIQFIRTRLKFGQKLRTT